MAVAASKTESMLARPRLLKEHHLFARIACGSASVHFPECDNRPGPFGPSENEAKLAKDDSDGLPAKVRTRGLCDDASARIGQNLKLCRAAAGMTQQTLAHRLGVSPQQLQKYERGTNRIAAATLALVARTLKVSAEQLMLLEERDNSISMSESPTTLDIKMLNAFMAIKNAKVRLKLFELVYDLSRSE